jgi:hypothetical protein
VVDPVRRGRLLAGQLCWDGAFGTHFFVDPQKLVAVLLIQTSGRDIHRFQTAAMQSIID